jgi:putative membrane-bound dehydrogenase-like protein
MRVTFLRRLCACLGFPLALLAASWPAMAVEVPLELPSIIDDRLQIELFASDPDIVTPCGLAVDARGRVLVVESHTHFRPENYQGPPADRIRMLEDTDADGRADRITTFFAGTRSTMNVGVHPDGSVYVATRMEIFRLRDTNDDGVADENTPIAHLETAGDYPHNGLSGFAFDFAGNVYFGLGENLGRVFKLIGSDGSHSSELEGGHVYRCRADGSEIRRVAIGFWNPFHVGFDAFGRLFAVDNDPDSLPPCRLVHIVDGGNYGYRYRNGRRGIHPFTAWNGELPGTLPMLAGTGEAPSAVVAYESDNLPAEYVGNLLVTSWGDHRLERYRPQPRGASFHAVREAFVQGGENFRPVGMAVAPDGSLFASDWVLQDYNLHGKGRVWRLSAKKPQLAERSQPPARAIHAVDRRMRETAARKLLDSPAGRQTLASLAANPEQSKPRVRALALTALAASGHLAPAREALRQDARVDVRLAAVHALGDTAKAADLNADEPSPEVRGEFLRHTLDPAVANTCWQLVSDGDAFLAEAARQGLFHLGLITPQLDLQKLSPQQRLAALLILREYRIPDGSKLLGQFLRDPDPDVRFAAVQWVGEERLAEFRGALTESLAAGPATQRIFGGYLAALERLDGVRREPSDEWAGEQYIVRALEDPQTSPQALRWALRMLRPDHPLLTLDRFRQYLASDDPAVRLEAVRSLRSSKLAGGSALLAEIASSPDYTPRLRAEAIVGLLPESPAATQTLVELAGSDEPAISAEALRSLRGAELDASAKSQLQDFAKGRPELQELVTRVLQPAPNEHASSTATEASPTDADVAHWLNVLHAGAQPGDPEAGERIFYHARSAACSRCHQVGGRGASVGPELTATTGVLDERRLVESIVRPSKEIAPQFVSWVILTTDGQSHTGVLVDELATGEQTYADAEGKLTQFKPTDIESRRPLPTSLMPAGLPAQLTAQEFRDLVAFLRSQGN